MTIPLDIIIGNIPLRRFIPDFSAPSAPPVESLLDDGPLQASDKDQHPDLCKLSTIFIQTRLKTIRIPQHHHRTKKALIAANIREDVSEFRIYGGSLQYLPRYGVYQEKLS